MKRLCLILYLLLYGVVCTGQNLVTEVSMPETDHNNTIEQLAHDLYHLVLAGNSTDEIIAMFHDEQDLAYNLQAIIIKIDELLQSQHSKEEIIQIIIENKESDDFFKKVKKYHLVLKIVLTTGAIIGLSYAFYLFYKWYFKKNWQLPGFAKQPHDNREQSRDEKQQDQPKDPIKDNVRDLGKEHVGDQEKTDVIAQQLRAISLDHDAQQADIKSQPLGVREVPLHHVQSRDQLVEELKLLDARVFGSSLGPIKKKALYHRSLHEAVARQLDQAGRIGFD